MVFLKDRLNAGVIEKTELEMKMKQLETQTEQLADPVEAAKVKKSLGIIDEEEAGYKSPEKSKSKKMDMNDEAAQKAREMALRMRTEQKQVAAKREAQRQKDMERMKKENEEEMAKIQERKEKMEKEKKEKHDAFVLKMQEHKKEMSLRIRNVNVRKSISQLGEKRNHDSENAYSESISRKGTIKKKASYKTTERSEKGGSVDLGNPNTNRYTPLYKKLQNAYDHQEEQETLEKKKRRLQEIRTLNKPVRPADIAEHALKYERTRGDHLNL